MTPADRSTGCAIFQRLLIAACLVMAGLTAPLGAQVTNTATDDVAVVVHPDTPVDNLTLGELRRLVLGDRGFWPASVRVTLLLRAPVAHERDVILRIVCQMTESQFRQHWIAKVFRADTAVAPKIVYSSEMSIEMVARIPGAITFVDASRVGKNLKVLKIDGRAPRDSGYVLR
jgi:ABC-type phosphate transport system substrate-binding protein